MPNSLLLLHLLLLLVEVQVREAHAREGERGVGAGEQRALNKKGKWGGDGVSAKWRAAHYGGQPVRTTGRKQVA